MPASTALNFISASLTVARNASRSRCAARDADDPRGLAELPAPLAMKQRRVKLAVGEIARPAENDEVKRIDLDDARGHVASQSG